MISNNKNALKPKTIGLLCLVLSLLALTPIMRIAAADGGQGQSEQSSNMQVSSGGNQAQVVSNIEANGVEKSYKAQLDTSQGVTVHVNFESDSESQNAESENEIEFQATFQNLVEFTDPSGVLTNTSTIIQSMDLTQLSYSPIQETQVTYNGIQGYELSTQATQGNFTFKVVAYAFPNSTAINATSLSPSSLKIVIYILNYPYKQSNSLLALQIRTQSDASVDTSNANSQEDIQSSASSLGEQAVFSWNGPLTVNGQSYSSPIKSSITSQGDEAKTLNLIYPHGQSIVHDPTIGVYLGSVPLYLQPTFMIGAAAVIAIVAALSIAMVSRRIRK
ncbi:MAG: hypothetical protein PXY39_11660 [archaeon]|nr:hypothetical protein [archaeon]